MLQGGEGKEKQNNKEEKQEEGKQTLIKYISHNVQLLLYMK